MKIFREYVSLEKTRAPTPKRWSQSEGLFDSIASGFQTKSYSPALLILVATASRFKKDCRSPRVSETATAGFLFETVNAERIAAWFSEIILNKVSADRPDPKWISLFRKSPPVPSACSPWDVKNTGSSSFRIVRVSIAIASAWDWIKASHCARCMLSSDSISLEDS